MGRGGGRERPSEAKLRANRENAHRPRPGTRRAADVGEEETLKQALRRARGLTEQAVAVLEQVLRGRNKALALKAAAELLDRAGLPRMSQPPIALSTEPPKLVILTHFDPPPGWSEVPPPMPEIGHEVVDDGEVVLDEPESAGSDAPPRTLG
jgi:hypothetical protein